MTDEVVDRVVYQRGSVGLGWLKQPLTDGWEMTKTVQNQNGPRECRKRPM